MNETVRSILNRRSIRSYEPEQISEKELQTILEAGQYAPSAMNQQSWDFTVIQDKKMIDHINQVCKDLMMKSDDPGTREGAAKEGFHVFYQAPTVILVSGGEKALAPQVDCAAAVENMMVAAASQGIGSCWIGITEYLFNSPEGDTLKKALEIPAGYKPLYTITLGYGTMQNPEAPPRKEGSIHYIR